MSSSLDKLLQGDSETKAAPADDILFSVPTGMIHLGVGAPDQSLLQLSVDAIRKGVEHRLTSENAPATLQYGPVKGDGRYLRELAKFLSAEYKSPVDADDLLATAGATQGLAWACTMFMRVGDPVFAPDPTYFLAERVFRDHRLNVNTVATNSEGLCMESLAQVLEQHLPVATRDEHPADRPFRGLIYCIPTFDNPTGRTLSLERRRQLVALARAHRVLIVCDDVYDILHLTPNVELPPRVFAVDRALGADCVISNGSFSKLFGPGIRLGWIEAGPAIIRQFLSSGFGYSGGGVNHFSACVMASVMALDLQRTLTANLRTVYAARLNALCDTLDAHLPPAVSYQRPHGGFFVWLSLPAHINCEALLETAKRDFQVAFQPGSLFSCATDQKLWSHNLRLSFAFYAEDDIREGALRVCRAIKSSLTQ